MITDTEIRVRGLAALSTSLGSIEAERFIALIQREPFDYTQWQETLFEAQSIEVLNEAATRHRDLKAEQLDGEQPATHGVAK
jgi:hypothetical protein